MVGAMGWWQQPPPDTFVELLPPEERENLRRLGKRLAFGQKQPIFERGDESRGVVVILHGVVKVCAPNAGGVEAVLAIRGSGDVVGEMSTVGTGRHGATVTALSPVECVWLEPVGFDRLLQRPQVWPALLGVLARRLQEADDLRLQLDGRNPVLRRLSRQLSTLGKYGQQRNGHIVLEIQLSQRDLASAIGASRSAVAKALKHLRDEGIVTTDRQRIDILRAAELRRLGNLM